MNNHSRNIFLLIGAILFLAAQPGCHSPTSPSEESQQMIPIGDNNQWTYTVSGAGAGQTLSTFQNWQFPVYQWDSVAKVWLSSQITGNQFISNNSGNWDNFESFSDNFIFAPYSNGSEKGLICGDAFEGSLGYRFWFVLPDHPTAPLSFHATLVDGYISDTAVYHASFDTTSIPETVPAGSFQCYKLVMRYDGQIGNLKINPDSVITVDTMYLTPGKGIVKRVIWRMRKSEYIIDGEPWTIESYPIEDYELSSYQIQ